MTSKSLQNDSSLSTFKDLKQQIKNQWLRKQTIKLLEEKPSRSFRSITKELGVTDSVLNRALDITVLKETKTGFSIEKILGAVLGVDLFFNIENIDDSIIHKAIEWVREKIIEFPILASILSGLALLIKKFGLDNISDTLIKFAPIFPILIPLVLIGGLAVLLPFLFTKIKPFFDNILNIAGHWNDEIGTFVDNAKVVAAEAADVLGIDETDCTVSGKSFPTFINWFKKLSLAKQIAWGGTTVLTGGLASAAAYALYQKDRLEFIDDCKKEEKEREEAEAIRLSFEPERAKFEICEDRKKAIRAQGLEPPPDVCADLGF